MGYATRDDFKALYRAIGEKRFDRLLWEAEQAMDDATTGVDGVQKLRVAFPTGERDVEAVRRCACALVDILWSIETTEAAAAASQGMVKREDGTVTGKVVTSLSAGGESIGFAAPGAAQGTKTAVDTAVGDPNARARLLAETVRRYLSGARDGNGVALLYMGPYPARR